MWKSMVTIASSIQRVKHHPRRRADKKTSKNRQLCLRLHQKVHAQNRFVLSRRCQRHTQKIRHQRIRCTFRNNMRISKRQSFLNQQAARIDNVFLSIASSSIRDRDQNREALTPHGRVAQVQGSSVLTFVPKSCSRHDHERSTCRLKKCHEVFV